MAEQALGRHDDQRPPEVRLDLSPECVKELGRRRQVANLYVVLGRGHQIAFEVGAGVLRPLALVAVGKEHDQTAHPVPFVECRRDELVDDDLGAVGEVAELGLPDHQHVGFDERVAVIEPEHRRLRQHAVVDAESRLIGFDVVERDIDLLVLGVEPRRVAVGEGASHAVLAAETNRSSLNQQGAEGQQLAKRPVDRAPLLDGLQLLRQSPADLAVELKTVGHGGQCGGDLEQLLVGRPGVGAVETVCVVEFGPDAGKGVAVPLVEDAGLLDALEGIEKPALEGVRELFALLQRNVVGALQLELVDGAGRRPVVDLLVHQRLGEGGLVALVVAVLAVTDHVDDNVLPELLAKPECEVDDVHHGLGIVAIDVEDRRLDHLRDIGRIAGGAGLAGEGGKADLVVDHDVDGAARRVALELGEVEGLGDQTLAGKGGVAVDQQRQHLGPRRGVVTPPLLGAGAALDHRVDGLEMAGVGGQADVDLGAGGGLIVRAEAAVVLDVAVTTVAVGADVVLELVEDHRVGLLEDVGENVEAAAVGHPHHDLFGPGLGSGLHELVDSGDQRFGALERKPFLALVAAVGKALEELGVDELGQDSVLFFAVERGSVADRLHLTLQPPPHRHVLDVQVLDADVAAVGVPENRDDLAQAERTWAAEMAGVVHLIEILFTQTEGLELEQGVGLEVVVERVEVGNQVAQVAVGEDEAGDLRLVGGTF